jgi:hypothetical protein
MDEGRELTTPGNLALALLMFTSLMATAWLVAVARRRAPNSRLSQLAFWALVAMPTISLAALLLSSRPLTWAAIPFPIVAAVCAALALRRQRKVG